MQEASSVATVPVRRLTADELLRLPDDGYRYALVRGELQRMTPAGFDHGAIIINLAVPLGQHVKAGRLGVVCGAETGFVLARDPDTVLAPDVAFVRRDRIPTTGRPQTFWEGAPDLAVEVRFPGDTRREVAAKVADWLAAGTLAVWAVDPSDESVTVHLPCRPPRCFGVAETLDGAPLLPAFRMPVVEVFAL